MRSIQNAEHSTKNKYLVQTQNDTHQNRMSFAKMADLLKRKNVIH